MTNTVNAGSSTNSFAVGHGTAQGSEPYDGGAPDQQAGAALNEGGRRDRETIVTQDVPVRVLSAANVEGIHEPRCREPDVHILLPSLLQLKSISERFTKLASSTMTSSSSSAAAASASSPKLELSANMHGSLRLRSATDALNISSVWTGLSSVSMGKTGAGSYQWADWAARSLPVRPSPFFASLPAPGSPSPSDGQHAGFIDDLALVLYVYLSNDDDSRSNAGGGVGEGDDSVLTVRLSLLTPPGPS